jgi:hypothetical protein
MRAHLQNVIRALLAALALGVISASAEASAGWGLIAEASAPARRETLWGLPRNDPAIAVGAILGGIGLLILFAWIAARVGDKS